MIKEFGRLSISTLNLKPVDGSKSRHAPFVFMLYVDKPEGSYVSFGRHVHRTIMWKKKRDDRLD